MSEHNWASSSDTLKLCEESSDEDINIAPIQIVRTSPMWSIYHGERSWSPLMNEIGLNT